MFPGMLWSLKSCNFPTSFSEVLSVLFKLMHARGKAFQRGGGGCEGKGLRDPSWTALAGYQLSQGTEPQSGGTCLYLVPP